MNLAINLGDKSVADLSTLGGSLKLYEKLSDNSHSFIGNLTVIDGKVGIGKAPTGNNILDVAGTIRANEIKVEAQTAAFVFEEDYYLRSLKEVEAFVKEYKHLPDIPSAVQMKADDMNLAEMNKLLLLKIEELTLYVIEQDEKTKKILEIMERNGLK